MPEGKYRPSAGKPPDFEVLHRQRVETPSVDLFRYSALTGNGHRIHFDRDYARESEGYPDLVVHGPLMATALVEFARRVIGDGRLPEHFSYRLSKPVFQGDGFELVIGAAVGGEIPVAVIDVSGSVSLAGQLVFADL